MERTDLGRIVAFTDGVMAVAITLLVLNIEVPDVSGEDLGEALVDLLPSLGSYVLSFALVGRFWVVHHNLFERLRAFDPALLGLNLLFLAAIVLVPFAANLFDEYPEESLSAAVFGGILGIAALINWIMHRHTVRANLIHQTHREAASAFASPVAFGFTGVFLLSVPVAFISPHIAQALWLSTILLRYPLRKLTGRTSSS